MYLDTQSGMLAVDKIVLIGALERRSTGDFHEITYEIAGEARQTRATADAVNRVFDAKIKRRIDKLRRIPS